MNERWEYLEVVSADDAPISDNPAMTAESADSGMVRRHEVDAPCRGGREMTWHSIASAPKDGSPVDVWAVFKDQWNESGARYPNARFLKGRWLDGYNNSIDWNEHKGEPNERGKKPTHWRPLPEPPGTEPAPEPIGETASGQISEAQWDVVFGETSRDKAIAALREWTPEKVADLKERSKLFQLMQLPGQPLGMHMGTSYLVADLMRYANALSALLAEEGTKTSRPFRSGNHGHHFG